MIETKDQFRHSNIKITFHLIKATVSLNLNWNQTGFLMWVKEECLQRQGVTSSNDTSSKMPFNHFVKNPFVENMIKNHFVKNSLLKT